MSNRPGFVIGTDENVKQKDINYFKFVFKLVQKMTPIRHRIGVILVNRMAVSHTDHEIKSLISTKMLLHPKSGVIVGLFIPPICQPTLSRRNWVVGADCMIVLPTRFPQMVNLVHKETADITDVVLHEIGHYLQWRDKKSIQNEDDADNRKHMLLDRMAKYLEIRRGRRIK